MSDIDPFISLADRTIGLEEEVKTLKVLSAQPYVICKQAQEIRVYPEPGTEPALEEREDDVLYFYKIEEPGEMVLVCNIPSANYKLDLSSWLSAAPGDGTTDISIDWGDNASAVAYALNSLEKPSTSKKFEVYTVEEREDEPVIEEDERHVERTELDSLMEAKSDLVAISSVDYPVTETPGRETITHTYATAGKYRITLKGSFKWGLGKETSNLALQKTLTSIELPSGKSPIKHVATYAFSSCSALTSIPQGLFANCTAVTNFSYCFYYCTALTSIPQGLFANCTKATSFRFCFYWCYALTSIPQGLFDDCTAVTDFGLCFDSCTALTSIPEGLFDNCTAVTNFGSCFDSCSALTSIPAGLFDNCTAVTNFTGCFYKCRALTSIPAGLFDNCTAVTNFSDCFRGCTAITSALPTLWISHASASHSSCFYNCTKATNYAAAQSAGWA